MKLVLGLTLLASSVNAFAFPKAPHDALKVKKHKSLTSINRSYDFEGIVKLSNCSGSLVIFSGMPLTAPAVVMTNGHCIQKSGGYLNPGEVMTDVPKIRSMKIFDKEQNLHNILTTKILYATMTKTDVAYYELDETYQEIFERTEVQPFLLDSVRPLLGQNIEIISGYWDRGYSCAIDGFVHLLKEGDWSFMDSIRYTSTCDTIGGTSGSPIILKGEKVVVAINNTSNESGQRCTVNNPCEVNANGDVTVRMGVRYGQQTYDVYSCLSPDFKIDLKVAGCNLPK
jgi:V8-like Glu-specific endopeptidase